VVPSGGNPPEVLVGHILAGVTYRDPVELTVCFSYSC